jgi:hypothetical protein
MSGLLVRAVLTGATAAAAAAVGGGRNAPASGVSPFGSNAAVHLARVGQIEVDLGSANPVGLRRVACVGAPRTTDCFVSGRQSSASTASP